MLQTLRIRNLALIDDVELQFDAGFNVLTGETGAGKSIIVGALSLILGGRASADHVRAGAEEARVDALFALDQPSRRLVDVLKEHGIAREDGFALEDGQLLVSRVVSNQGRSRAYAAGNLVAVSVLSAIGEELVDLHGQHEHQSLLKTARQLDLLDDFGGLSGLTGEMAVHYDRYHALCREIETLEADDREQTRRIEFRRFEVAEIDRANLTANEEEELRARRNLMMNAERIFALTSSAHAKIYGGDEGGAAIDSVDAAAKDLDELSAIHESFQALSATLNDARATLESIADELRRHADELSFEPRELDEVNSRLSVIRELMRKYGDSTPEILAYRDEAQREIEAFDQRDERLAENRKQRDDAHAAAMHTAQELSKKRRAIGDKLSKSVTATIRKLGMAGGTYSVAIEDAPLGVRGTDRIEFVLAANAGEPEKPLRKVASGGEMSRLMLALKSAFASADRVPTLIFDEIDAGIGGAVARQVGERMAQLAETHQLICVTHLPQIAAAASRHFNVSKKTAAGRTTTIVRVVDEDSRVGEVARLLDGDATSVSRQHAEELLKRNAS